MPLHNRSAIIFSSAPFEGQKPGTSGLRKAVKVFQQKNYTENFIQCSLWALEKQLKGSTLVVGGDGRYFMATCTSLIIKICAANKVSKLIVGQVSRLQLKQRHICNDLILVRVDFSQLQLSPI